MSRQLHVYMACSISGSVCTEIPKVQKPGWSISRGMIQFILRQHQGAMSDHLIRMHLTGEPSAPTSLRGKQWRLYTPTGTSSSFRPSTGIMSWQNKESKSTNGSNAMHILDTKKRLLEIKQARKIWNQQTTVTRLGNSQYWTAVFWSGNLLYWNSGTNRMKHFCH